MTTAAVQETQGTPAPDSARDPGNVPDHPDLRRPTFLELTALAEDGGDVLEEVSELGILVNPDPEIEGIGADTFVADRSKLLAMADRLLKRLARDESEVSDLTAAAKAEVALVTTRYQAAIEKQSKRATWKRFVLEQLAAILFPDARAKSKSINLPYGTLGRRDYKGAPELVDEAAAIQRCFADNRRDLVKLTITTTAEELEDLLVSAFQRIEKDGLKGKGTLTESVREEVDTLIARGERSDFDLSLRVKLALAWGELKKEPAAALFAIPKEGATGGVKMAGPTTKYFADVLEG